MAQKAKGYFIEFNSRTRADTCDINCLYGCEITIIEIWYSLSMFQPNY